MAYIVMAYVKVTIRDVVEGAGACGRRSVQHRVGETKPRRPARLADCSQKKYDFGPYPYGLKSYGLSDYGLHSHGLYIHGIGGHDVYAYGLYS